MANQINTGDMDLVTRVLMAEAGGEGNLGMLASASVMVNRAKATGLSLAQIVSQAGQFEPMMTDAGRQRMRNFRPGTKLWNDAQTAISRAVAGEDPTGGATHFWSPRAQRAAGRAAPSWGRQGGTMIGNHSFHKVGYGNRSTRNAYSLGDGGNVTVAASSAPAGERPDMTPMSLDERRRLSRASYFGELDIAGRRAAQRETELGQVTSREAHNNVPASEPFNALLAGTTRDIRGDGQTTDGVTNAAATRFAEQNVAVAADDHIKSFMQQGAHAANELPTTRLYRAIERQFFDDTPDDPNWSYGSVMEEVEKGKTLREVEDLRRSNSSSDLAFRLQRQAERQDAARSLDNTSGQVLNFGMQMLDPVSWAAAGGVGKGLQVLKMGSSALALGQGAARNAAVVGSLATEGALGNVAITAVLEASGEYKTADDYMMDALVGAGMGAAFTPLVSRAGHAQARRLDAATQEVIDESVGAAIERRILNTEAAMRELGPEATPAQINAKRAEIDLSSAVALQDDFANPFPVEAQLRVADRQIPEGVKSALDAEAHLYAEGPERDGITEIRHTAMNIDAASPSDPRRGFTEKAMGRLGLSSAGLTMGRSQSPVLRGIGKLFAEGASGFSGRRYTVAMDAVQNQMSLDANLVTIDSAFMTWRKSTDYTLIQQFSDTQVMEQFMDKVSRELRQRERPDLYPRSQEPGVAAAADTFRDFYKKAGDMQKQWKTVGAGAIKEGAEWYFPQEISARKLLQVAQTEGGLSRYQGAIAEQAETIFGWDRKFAKDFSGKYIRGAIERANSSYTTPANLSNPHAHDFVKAIIDEMKVGKKGRDLEAVKKVEAAFARGGAKQTKARLDFDVNHVYGSGENTYSLMDIMSTDQLSLARSYSRRVAGEVALTKAGVYGKHGLDEVRAALMVDRAKDLITDKEMQAFDQTVAEIMGQPFGGSMKGGLAMDNLRLLSSAINLGGAIFNQVAETTNAFATIGVRNTLSSIPEVPRMIEEITAMRKGDKTENPWIGFMEDQLGYGPGSEAYIQDRIFDSPQENGSLYGTDNTGNFSRAARGLSHAQHVISGQRVATAVQTRMMAERIIQKAIKDVRKPNLSELDIRILEDMGFDAKLRDALKRDDAVRVDDAGNIIGTDITGSAMDARDKALIVAATNRGAHQIIQRTYPGEAGVWAHNDVLKLLLQFRTYPIVAAEKQWMRQVLVQGGSSTAVGIGRTVGTMVGALSFIAPMHIARVHLQSLGMSEEKRQEYLERRLSAPAFTQALFNYLSAAHLTGDVIEFGGKSVTGFAGVFGVDVPALEGMANTRGDFVGGSVAPSLGVVNDAAKVATGDLSRLPNLIVGRNLPFLAIPKNVVDSIGDEEE